MAWYCQSILLLSQDACKPEAIHRALDEKTATSERRGWPVSLGMNRPPQPPNRSAKALLTSGVPMTMMIAPTTRARRINIASTTTSSRFPGLVLLHVKALRQRTCIGRGQARESDGQATHLLGGGW